MHQLVLSEKLEKDFPIAAYHFSKAVFYMLPGAHEEEKGLKGG